MVCAVLDSGLSSGGWTNITARVRPFECAQHLQRREVDFAHHGVRRVLHVELMLGHQDEGVPVLAA